MDPFKQSAVSFFLDVVAGQSADTAVQFLEATGWKVDDALELYYASGPGWGSLPPKVEDDRIQPPSPIHPSEEYSSESQIDPPGQESPGYDEAFAEWEDGENGLVVQPTDTAETPLLGPQSFEETQQSDDSEQSDNSESDQEEETQKSDDSEQSEDSESDQEEETQQSEDSESDQESDTSSSSDSSDNESSQPPRSLMYRGNFYQAKMKGSIDNKWLIVNIQSTKEFSSHRLNRDTWANEAVAQTIRDNFIFWQVNDESEEGKKVCCFYNLVSLPAILVIDPITGKKMKAWSGMIEPEKLLEDLLPSLDSGPQEAISKSASNRTFTVLEKGTASTSSLTVTEGQSVLEKEEEGKNNEGVEDIFETVKVPSYPPLPEEPTGERGLLCRVGIRFPDGKRVQRNFLATDPIQFLWSFSSSVMEGTTLPFHFLLVTPGVSKKQLDYVTSMNFREAGLSNTMITLVLD